MCGKTLEQLAAAGVGNVTERSVPLEDSANPAVENAERYAAGNNFQAATPEQVATMEENRDHPYRITRGAWTTEVLDAMADEMIKELNTLVAIAEKHTPKGEGVTHFCIVAVPTHEGKDAGSFVLDTSGGNNLRAFAGILQGVADQQSGGGGLQDLRNELRAAGLDVKL